MVAHHTLDVTDKVQILISQPILNTLIMSRVNENTNLYVLVEWPDSQDYTTPSGHRPKCCVPGPESSVFVPLNYFNKVNNLRLTVVDKTYE